VLRGIVVPVALFSEIPQQGGYDGLLSLSFLPAVQSRTRMMTLKHDWYTSLKCGLHDFQPLNRTCGKILYRLKNISLSPAFMMLTSNLLA